MAVGNKKKFPSPVVPMSVPEASKRDWDCNPDGVLPLPGNGTDPSDYNNNGISAGRKMCFPSRIGRGESPNDFGYVNTVTVNGTGSSRGQGSNQEYNWSDGTDGYFNKNREWPGGNRTSE